MPQVGHHAPFRDADAEAIPVERREFAADAVREGSQLIGQELVQDELGQDVSDRCLCNEATYGAAVQAVAVLDIVAGATIWFSLS